MNPLVRCNAIHPFLALVFRLLSSPLVHPPHENPSSLWGDRQTPNSDIPEFSLSFRFELRLVWDST